MEEGIHLVRTIHSPPPAEELPGSDGTLAVCLIDRSIGAFLIPSKSAPYDSRWD